MKECLRKIWKIKLTRDKVETREKRKCSLKCYLNWGLIWTLKLADSHRSMNFAANEGVLVSKLMFPDGDIATTLPLRYDKIAFLIHYGLMTYYQDNQEKKIYYRNVRFSCKPSTKPIIKLHKKGKLSYVFYTSISFFGRSKGLKSVRKV